MNKPKKKMGRPLVPDNKKKVSCNFTVPYKEKQRIDKITGDKSAFISKVVSSIPNKWITAYNRSPKKFLGKELILGSNPYSSPTLPLKN